MRESTYFISNDGVTFDNEYSCEQYERSKREKVGVHCLNANRQYVGLLGQVDINRVDYVFTPSEEKRKAFYQWVEEDGLDVITAESSFFCWNDIDEIFEPMEHQINRIFDDLNALKEVEEKLRSKAETA